VLRYGTRSQPVSRVRIPSLSAIRLRLSFFRITFRLLPSVVDGQNCTVDSSLTQSLGHSSDMSSSSFVRNDSLLAMRATSRANRRRSTQESRLSSHAESSFSSLRSCHRTTAARMDAMNRLTQTRAVPRMVSPLTGSARPQFKVDSSLTDI
jgi:hypothetical protein